MSYTLFLFWPYTIILLSLRYYYKHLYLICTCKKKVDMMRRIDIKNYKMNELWQ